MVVRNEMLNEILTSMPASSNKMHLAFLFILIDNYIAGTLSQEDFLNDIKAFLEKK